MNNQLRSYVPKGLVRATEENLRRFRVRRDATLRHASGILEALDTPVSLGVWLRVKYELWDDLVQKTINPRDYNDALLFDLDFQAVSLLAKAEFLATSFDKKKRALDAFEDGEKRCGITNAKIRRARRGNSSFCDEWLHSAVIRKIARVLGPFDITAVLDDSRWGPGVTQVVRGCDCSPARKFDEDNQASSSLCALFLPAMQAAYPSWEQLQNVEVVEGCAVLTVPKNAKTDRTIAVEPGLNSFIQLGIGRLIRRRLRHAGFDLNSDLRNQRGAYVGSIDDSLATIDFKAASDSISLELVEELLPPEWFIPLNAARSKSYRLPGQSARPSEKFSTMGNGFTFELESLIFVAAGIACCAKVGVDPDRVAIFGDDLVIPKEAVSELVSLVASYGFEINSEKSYHETPFRESCGSFYFGGRDVKPFYIRKALQRAKDVFHLANAIRDRAHRLGFRWGCDIRLRAAWRRCVAELPELLRLYGPATAGDNCIAVSPTEVRLRPSHISERSPGHEGYYYSSLVDVPVECTRDSLGLLLARLHSPSVDRASYNDTPLRAKVKWRLKNHCHTLLWYDFGEWLTP